MEGMLIITEAIEAANRSITAFLEVLADIPQESLTKPKTVGDWSIKDIIIHLAVWEEEAARAFEIWKIGIEPDWSHIDNLDKFNQESINSRRRWSTSKAIEHLKTVHNGIIENIKSFPESEFAKRGGMPRWLYSQITSHIEEHAAKVAAYKHRLTALPESKM